MIYISSQYCSSIEVSSKTKGITHSFHTHNLAHAAPDKWPLKI